MIDFIKRKLAKRKLMSQGQKFDYLVKSFNLEGVGEIDYAEWQNPFAYSMIVSKNKLDFFKQFINPGDVAIDIGGNVGDTALPMMLAAGPEGLVFALEPNPHLFKVLKANSDLNLDKGKMIPLPFAATEEDGDFFYNSSEATFNNGGISKEATAKHGKYQLENKIQGVNLDRYLRNSYGTELSKLSCIKVDTEGYDKQILLSLKSVIEEFKPTVMFEVFKRLTKIEREELFDLFDQHGYVVYYFEDFDITKSTQKLARNDMSNWRHFEAYAVHPG
jgi:FkbM family methyltransferase